MHRILPMIDLINIFNLWCIPLNSVELNDLWPTLCDDEILLRKMNANIFFLSSYVSSYFSHHLRLFRNLLRIIKNDRMVWLLPPFADKWILVPGDESLNFLPYACNNYLYISISATHFGLWCEMEMDGRRKLFSFSSKTFNWKMYNLWEEKLNY